MRLRTQASPHTEPLSRVPPKPCENSTTGWPPAGTGSASEGQRMRTGTSRSRRLSVQVSSSVATGCACARGVAAKPSAKAKAWRRCSRTGGGIGGVHGGSVARLRQAHVNGRLRSPLEWPDYPALAAAVNRAVETGLVPGGQYTALLIDEAHDFEDAWLQMAARLVTPASNSLLVLYDDATAFWGSCGRPLSRYRRRWNARTDCGCSPRACMRPICWVSRSKCRPKWCFSPTAPPAR